MKALLKWAAAPLLIAAATAAASGSASAAPSAAGIWIDHTGRAATEITEVGGKLVGRLVWFKDPANSKSGCGLQIIGDVKPVSGGKWDGGWILDPEKDSKYDVEITPMGDKLKVMGYAGVKFLSETMMWTRAAPDIKRCDQTAERTPTPPNALPGGTGAPEEKPGPNTGPRIVTPGPAPTPTPPPGEEEKPRTTARNGEKDCKFQTPYFTITVPCPD